MTMAPRRPANVPRAGRTGGVEPWSLWNWGDICGYCTGQRAVWCPHCGGFDSSDCPVCRRTGQVACPACAGGFYEKWSPR